MTNPNLSQLFSRITRGKYAHLESLLQNRRIEWQKEYDGHVLGEILDCCPEGFRLPVKLAIINAYLKAPHKCPPQSAEAIQDSIPFRETGLELSWDRALEISWCPVPIPLTAGEKTAVQTFLVGWCKGNNRLEISKILLREMADETQKAIQTAATLTQKKHPGALYCLRAGGIGTSPVQGRSLALPLYAAFTAAAEGWEMPNLLLSGDIGENGHLLPVADITQKKETALEHGYSGLIFPNQEHSSNEFLFPVQTPEQALLLAKSDSPRLRKTIHHFLAHLHDPGQTVLELPRLNENCLELLARDYQRQIGKTFLSAILKAQQDTRSMLSRLEEEMEMANWSMRRMQAILSFFPEPEELKDAAIAPDILFRLAWLKYMLKNHSGLLREGDEWAGLSEKAVNRVLDMEDCDFNGLAHAVKFHAGRLVRERHNAFIFRPDLPETLEPQLKDLIKCTENYYRERKKRGSPTSKHLGALWGTIAQNFAFCGPEYLEETQKYAWAAWEAFGSRDDIEDCRRCVSYLYFACLDAGRLEEARDYLKRLGQAPIPNSKQLENEPFLALAFARWLLEGEQPVPRLLDELKKTAAISDMRHPWQLVLYNLAACEPEKNAALEMSKRSLDFCMHSDSGPPVRAMALLPLSVIYEKKLLPFAEIERQIKKTQQIIRLSLNKTGHFNLIVKAEPREVLPIVQEEKKNLFPFTYR